MLIDSLVYAIEKSGCLDGFWDKLDAGQDATLSVASSARPFLVAARFAHKPQPTLVVIAGEDAALTFARGVAAYLGDERVLAFPERDDYPFAPKEPSTKRRVAAAKQAARRMQAAYALEAGRPVVVVASARSLLRLMAPPSSGAARPLVFRPGQEVADMPEARGRALEEFDDVARALEDAGYENTGELDGPGTFCVRGGVIDVYPGNLTFPVRLDYFGDELDEIRRIVPSTGQTISALDEVEVYPVREFSCSESLRLKAEQKLKRPARTNPALRDLLEQLEGGLHFAGADALLPYLYDETVPLGAYLRKGSLCALLEPRSLFDDAVHAATDIDSRAKGSNIALDGLYANPAQLDFGGDVRATYLSIMRAGSGVDAELPVKRVEVAGHPDKLYGRLRQLTDDHYTVVFSVPNFRARQDMKLALVEQGLPIQERLDVLEGEEDPAGDADASLSGSRIKNTALAREDAARVSREDELDELKRRRLRRGVVNIVDVDVPLGMIIPKAHLALVSVADTQGASGQHPTRRVDVTEITFPYKPGDYVVHAAHGVALFSGLVRREIDGTMRDYLELEYAENDKLFVPVEQLDRVTRYVGPEGSNPRLTRLNTSDWSRALSRARKATKKLAFDLVDVYARRASVQGFRFSPDTPWQREMEEAFPYQETPDQLAAIADVKADMQSSRPMDRLICGDVGFGKTEVALRAAFKATQDKKQVMVLCPTTILAQQHYINFKERCEPFGVKVEVLSRFRTPQEQQRALAGFADGTVDILVGTHRLLSRDVNPHDLGLVIIDEEQRFGVGHKEQMKNLREYIDVLTLSATPIPRTMQMSLSGVRDMSLILTPPDERRPVEVHVGEWDPDVVSAAIRRELARHGQVYYVSNRVRSIDEAVERVHAAAGEARIGVAHGQMDKDALERVMEDFAAGELDVLVATTIIESGIDNPHTNTLIIEDSQRLGLAQMYQLKGRVGRSSTQAYAYFMFPDNVPLTEEATARLTALNEHQELGSGMRIAMRDLEIRGAGDILGAEQSGNMSAVGFDLFAQMLANAVNATREGKPQGADELPPALSDTTVNVPGDTFLPEDYIPDTDERVLWYRKLASASTVDAVCDIERDLAAKRPDMPPEARNLFTKSKIKAYACEHHITLVSVVAGKLVIEPVDVSSDQMTKLRRAGARYLADKRKLRVPMHYVEQGDAGKPAAARRKGQGRMRSQAGRDRATKLEQERQEAARAAEEKRREEQAGGSVLRAVAEFLEQLK
ncbi:MAG: transcription-repair coupling factor [Eggerthellaceae bacterium]|jgi:transcription-repair coupling factor (superfamily II helicase)